MQSLRISAIKYSLVLVNDRSSGGAIPAAVFVYKVFVADPQIFINKFG